MAQNGPERADSSRVIGFFLDFVSSGNGSIDEASRPRMSQMRHCTLNYIALHKSDMISVYYDGARKGLSQAPVPVRRHRPACRPAAGRAISPQRTHAMANSDPFSPSVIPFEVPEQVRAFAEKGVSQARDNYARFKDAAESHNGTIEAVFTSASKGASAYSAKMLEFFKANTTASL